MHVPQTKLKLPGKQVFDLCTSLAAITVMCKSLFDKLFGSFTQLCLLQSNRSVFIACHLGCLFIDLFNCLISLGLRMDSSVLFRKIISLRLDLHMFTSVNTYAGATKSYSDSSHLSQFSVCKASMHLALCSVRLTTSR